MFGLGRSSKETTEDANNGSPLHKEKALNARLGRAMTRAEKENKKTIKLLILGSGGGGKTTLRKQFSRLYASAFRDAKTRIEVKEIILNNLIEGLKATISAAQAFAGGIQSSDAKSAAVMISNMPDDSCKLNEEIVAAMRELYKDPVVQETLSKHRSRYQLQECFLPYFESVQNFPTWGGPIWIPSEDDCVRSRVRSTGIIEVEFEFERNRYRILDAGGQRAERRKWIHAFEDVTALIFVVSLTEYDEVLFEDKAKNRLQESLEVWEELVNTSHFLNMPILLFLNKLDLFKDKLEIRKIGLNRSGLFPDAPVDATVEEGIAWITEQFQKRRVKSNPALLYVHTTVAVDADQINNVFKDVREIVLLRVMSSQGLM